MAAKNMFLKCHSRFKDGKEHRYYSIAEKMACAGGRRIDRHVFYLGEINDSQREAWLKCIEVFDVQAQDQTRLALFASDQPVPAHATACGVQVRLAEFRLCRPRQWGACWVFLLLWEQLKLGEFWSQRLPASREHTSWYHILIVLCAYRWIDPGSEWRLHREWYSRSAMGDLLDEDFGLAAKDNFYRCLDKLVEHKAALFGFLQERWKDLFGVTFDVLLYDLTSTYFESDPPFPENDKRQHGYSRDHRGDCVQVIIALVVTPEGLPLAYEVLPGNTADNTTLKDFLARIERQYGRARRIWLMDRGVPTEAVLAEMRQADPPVQYLVGTPKGRLSRLEKALLAKPWAEARPGVLVNLLPQDGELYVFAQSADRVAKERAMRRRQMRWLWARLTQLAAMKLTREELLMRLGAARKQARTAWRVMAIEVAADNATFSFRLDRAKLRQVRRREGRYLLRTNLTDDDPARLWGLYLQLVGVEEAFGNIKGDLAIRPVFHQLEARIEAHIFIAFLPTAC